MTSRQRVEAALRHEAPDRTPIFEYVLLPPLAERILGRPFAENPEYWPMLQQAKGWEGAVRQMAADRLDLAENLGHDLLYVLPNPLPEPAPEALEPKPGDDPVEQLRRRNQRWKRAEPLKDERFLVYRCLQDGMRRRGIDLPLFAPAYEHGVWTDTALMQTMLLEPAVAREHFQLATRRSLQYIEKYLALGIEQIGVGGDFAGNRPLISPNCYREFIVPEIRILTKRIHARGAYAVNASDGNLWPVIEDFLLGCRVDGYIEIDRHAGMDLRRLKRGYGDRITFYGNMDCGNVLSFGSQENVRRQTLECLEAGRGRGGHIFTAGNAITASVSLDSYAAMVNAYRDRFGLSRWTPPD